MPRSKYRSFYETAEWKRLRHEALERDNYRCTYCGGPGNQADHVIPRSLGGRDAIDNLACSCVWCNNVAGGEWFADIEDKRRWIAARIHERDYPDVGHGLTLSQRQSLRKGTPYPLSMERAFARAEATLDRRPLKTNVGRPATYRDRHLYPQQGGKKARRVRRQRRALAEWDG